MAVLTRRGVLGIGCAAAVPMINRNAYALAASEPRRYSKRAIDLVRESLVIDMLAPIKIDFEPAFYSKPMSAQDE
ncbi:hypothetical protein ACC848_45260, partial [Rhizobium johnstonii]